MKIYLASSEKYVGNIQEDIYIRDHYLMNNVESEIDTIDNISRKAKSKDVVILKSIWGYHTNYELFKNQILDLKNKCIILVNDYDFIFWNINKYDYLNDIKDIGIIPTLFLDIKNLKSDDEIIHSISEAAKNFNVDTVVVKPSISESGYLTYKYKLDENNNEIIKSIKDKDLDFILQPYRDSILEGEISVILINGVSYYGVKRFPGVLEEKKDVIYLEIADIPEDIKNKILKLNDFLLNKFKILPNICRVDFIKNDNSYEILEVELIDPDLFFRNIPEKIKEKVFSAFNKPLNIEIYLNNNL